MSFEFQQVFICKHLTLSLDTRIENKDIISDLTLHFDVNSVSAKARRSYTIKNEQAQEFSGVERDIMREKRSGDLCLCCSLRWYYHFSGEILKLLSVIQTRHCPPLQIKPCDE